MKFERGPDPGPFADYREYRPFLQRLFQERCAYCLAPSRMLGGAEAMHIDHFKPQDRYSHLRNNWQNLYYCCPVCNSHYKKNRPTEAEEREGRRFVDPCTDDFDDHIRLVREKKTGRWCRVRGRSAAGRYSIAVLELNRRPFLREYWGQLDQRERSLRNLLRSCERLRKAALKRRADEQLSDLRDLRLSLEEQLCRVLSDCLLRRAS